MVACLRALAAARPNDTGLVVVGKRGELRFDYATLDRRARAVATQLQQRHAPGERALLLLENDEHYVVGFFACLYAGMIAVPAFPPEPLREQALARLAGIAADAQAACILATSAILQGTGTAMYKLGVKDVLAVDEVADGRAAEWLPHAPQDGDIAFLQYTSGSTAAPKGVMVSHGNLMANERAISDGMQITGADVMVTWLPLYHDMGLIGGMLQPFRVGAMLVLMSPSWFVERPVRWMDAMSRYRGTVSGAPDFAFRLSTDRVKDAQLKELDLSCVRVLYSGAEPVRHGTLERFVERFAPAGLDPAVLYPCYGLAEATLFVSGGRHMGMVAQGFSAQALAGGRAERDEDGPVQVACGYAALEHGIAIMEPERHTEMADGEVGEIWAWGPSIAQGYWRNQGASDATFVQHAGRRWLRTGDLGFLHGGQLYICGRRKDLIILRGHNVYPQDLELALEGAVDVIRKGRVAVFAVPAAEGDGIGVALEVSKAVQKLASPQALVDMLGEALGDLCQEPLSVALLLNPGSLPKTSSGKLQRAACRTGWQERSLDAYAIYEFGAWPLARGASAGNRSGGVAASEAVAKDPQGRHEPHVAHGGPAAGKEAVLASLWQAVLHQDAPAPQRHAHFFASGGNSLAAAQLVARIREHWQLDYTLQMLFSAPRLADIAAALDTLESSGARIVHQAIPVAERGVQPMPASHAQQRQWLLWQMDPSSSAYHITGALRLHGALDMAQLHRVLAALEQRHESLRTVFATQADGQRGQRILPPQAWREGSTSPLALADLRGVPAAGREAAAALQAQAWQAQPFELEQGPLWRAGLIRLDDDEHLLVLVLHHIIADGASLQVLVAEWAALYAAQGATQEAAQGNAGLPPPAVQYADYAQWQRDWLGQGAAQQQLAYWRAELGGEHPLLALQGDAPRRAAEAWPAAEHRFVLPPGLASRLRTAAEGKTLFTVLLTAFQALLHRYSGMTDVRVGVPVANRGRSELQGVVGMFVNTQVMRSLADSRSTLAALLEQTASRVGGAQANQDLPFEQLLDALRAEGGLGQQALFDVMFNHVQEPHRALTRAGGLSLSPYDVPAQTAQFELVLETLEQPDGALHARLVYAEGLFSSARMERMAEHYVRMLEVLVAQPASALGAVPLLGEEETAWQLARAMPQQPAGAARLARSALPAGAARPTTIHGLIEAQLLRAPDAPALIADGASVSYAELNQRANRLARRLIAHGAGPESCVAVAFERGPALAVGLLAVLKAGAAVFQHPGQPLGRIAWLDPSYPPERLAWMLEDSGAAILLTQSSLQTALPPARATVLADMPDAPDAGSVSAAPGANPGVPLCDASLAYIIYTSGSTGKPKGVAVPHRALAAHLQAMSAFHGLSPADRVLLFSSICFDAAADQLWAPLLSGAAVVIADPEKLDAEELLHMVDTAGVTVMDLPPAYLRQLCARLEGRTLPMRLCIAGGEGWSAAALDATRAALPGVQLVNAYGPTEAVITATAWRAGSEGCGSAAYAPLGLPLGDRSAYVMDAELNLLPRGQAGELCIGGSGLARGYRDRPGLTADRFVADPYSVQGGRLYRTGDLVRWNACGQLEYLGRIDHQVKVRGFRIELGEIEARLLAQDGVRAAVVVAHKNGGASLAAYVALHPGAATDASQLKGALTATLPPYMVPASVTLLDSLPMTAGGKIDRKALPDPAASGCAPFAEPLGETEQALARLWAEVLALPRVGRNDNFFEAGGHSLKAMELAALLQQRHGWQAPVRSFFEWPVLSDYAQQVLAPQLSSSAKLDAIDNLLAEFEV
jgi:amino acid adenylation domain-containing protein